MAKRQKKVGASARARSSGLRWAVPAVVLIGSIAVALFVARSRAATDAVERVPCAARTLPRVEGCTPRRCGRTVVDGFATATEVEELRGLAAKGMALGGGSGAPTILDLQSGALSLDDQFIDVHVRLNQTGGSAYTREEVAVYKEIIGRITHLIAHTFDSEPSQLFLTAPTFFSRIDGSRPAVTPHDEYWHSHVDTLQYGSFEYTSLLYLTDHADDFQGGKLHFDAVNGRPAKLIAPKRGRLALFTSGEEFPHSVQQVTGGTRLALTIAFTCQREAAIVDFLGRVQS